MYTPCFQGCSSHLASYVIHKPPSGLISDTILIPVALTLSRPITGIERLPARSKLPRLPPYFALDIFLSFDSRVTFRHLPRYCRPDRQPCRGPFSQSAHPLFFRKYDGVPEERTPTSSWWPKQRNEDINVLDQPLPEVQARMRRPARFVTKPSPLTPLLNLGTRFLVVEENCDARIIKLQ